MNQFHFKLGTKHPYHKESEIQVSPNGGLRFFPRGDNSDVVKIY